MSRRFSVVIAHDPTWTASSSPHPFSTLVVSYCPTTSFVITLWLEAIQVDVGSLKILGLGEWSPLTGNTSGSRSPEPDVFVH